MTRPSGHKLIMSAMIALWVVVTMVVLELLRIEIYWPTFAVLNLLTIIGFTRGNILKVFLSCIAGIGISLGYLWACGALGPWMGEMGANLSMLFLVIFAILALDELAPICLNVHTIIVFTFCMVNAHEFAISWRHTLISTLLGGGVALAGVLGIIKWMARPAEEA